MSINITECFDNIIGLSDTNCDCWADGQPIEFNESKSGLYITDLEPLASLQGAADCEKSDVWTMLEKARSQAIFQFKSDAIAALNQYRKEARQKFIGAIGRQVFTGNMNIQSTYSGVRFRCANIRSGLIKIKKIGCLFNQTANIPLSIYNNNNELVASVTVTSQANAFKNNTLSSAIELPMYQKYQRNLEYYFVYELTGGLQPKNNDLSCNCGGFIPVFDINNPYWTKKVYDVRNEWAKWLMACNFETSTLDFSNSTTATGSNLMNGLTFEVEISCKFEEEFCYDEMDFVGDPFSLSIALAIQYKSAEIACKNIFQSTNLNREVLVNRDNLTIAITDFQKMYKEKIDFIGKYLEYSKSGCFSCREQSGFQKRTLLV